MILSSRHFWVGLGWGVVLMEYEDRDINPNRASQRLPGDRDD